MELLRICGFCLTALVLIVLLKQYLPRLLHWRLFWGCWR